MRRFPRLKKSSRFRTPRGLRIKRNQRFEPKLEASNKTPKVRSSYEKKCVEFFEKNHISYQYESLLLIGGRKYRPDFFLPEYDTFLEICGYNHMPFYRDRTRHKKEIYRKYGLKVIFIMYNGKGSIEKLLEEELNILKVN